MAHQGVTFTENKYSLIKITQKKRLRMLNLEGLNKIISKKN